MKRFTIRDIKEMKAKEIIPMITAYDYTSARIANEAGFPIVLVGDSLGMVVLGYETTVPVTMDEMVHHTRAVVRGSSRALVVLDMPFMTYQADPADAVRNSGRALKEAGAQAVKLEGGEKVAATVRRIVDTGIPVMGHIGVTPQSIHAFGGYRVRGKLRREALQLIRDAEALQEAGAFSVVLELVPAQLARIITRRLSIPTIGIGAGPHCDGQVQVFHDLLGLYTDFVPKHTRQYARLADVIGVALTRYISDVKSRAFPTDKESTSMDEQVVSELEDLVGERASHDSEEAQSAASAQRQRK
jgi:3-methyl-2-oxobutanoate hydroxymethyltransferase